MKLHLRKRLTFYFGTVILLVGVIYGIMGQYAKANWFLLLYVSIWALARENNHS